MVTRLIALAAAALLALGGSAAPALADPTGQTDAQIRQQHRNDRAPDPGAPVCASSKLPMSTAAPVSYLPRPGDPRAERLVATDDKGCLLIDTMKDSAPATIHSDPSTLGIHTVRLGMDGKVPLSPRVAHVVIYGPDGQIIVDTLGKQPATITADPATLGITAVAPGQPTIPGIVDSPRKPAIYHDTVCFGTDVCVFTVVPMPYYGFYGVAGTDQFWMTRRTGWRTGSIYTASMCLYAAGCYPKTGPNKTYPFDVEYNGVSVTIY